ncbi:hypothetical protein PPERSA_05621 [Pseudocohnilembus persalinus]|uniref:Uncharacterized protein n=1 Tax=Pseudocohnilembus persalinus TaxID=266149 RepID=A0A0V0QGK9_PSEPJ|nr:hypothetical protein PPERSA_05621 [Pseudocohnilembus persalinus]|eukprot:KRX01221.1 hypothetical protein PPERSA_05621 [Pseudocohnilembus persalinus]
MKKWEEQQKKKLYQKKINNVKSTLATGTKSPKTNLVEKSVKSTATNSKNQTPSSSYSKTRSLIGDYYEGEKEDLNQIPLYKLLKMQSLQQYAKQLINRGYGYKLTKFNYMTQTQLNALFEEIKVAPGHKTKLMALIDFIGELLPEELRQIQGTVPGSAASNYSKYSSENKKRYTSDKISITSSTAKPSQRKNIQSNIRPVSAKTQINVHKIQSQNQQYKSSQPYEKSNSQQNLSHKYRNTNNMSQNSQNSQISRNQLGNQNNLQQIPSSAREDFQNLYGKNQQISGQFLSESGDDIDDSISRDLQKYRQLQQLQENSQEDYDQDLAQNINNYLSNSSGKKNNQQQNKKQIQQYEYEQQQYDDDLGEDSEEFYLNKDIQLQLKEIGVDYFMEPNFSEQKYFEQQQYQHEKTPQIDKKQPNIQDQLSKQNKQSEQDVLGDTLRNIINKYQTENDFENDINPSQISKKDVQYNFLKNSQAQDQIQQQSQVNNQKPEQSYGNEFMDYNDDFEQEDDDYDYKKDFNDNGNKNQYSSIKEDINQNNNDEDIVEQEIEIDKDYDYQHQKTPIIQDKKAVPNKTIQEKDNNQKVQKQTETKITQKKQENAYLKNKKPIQQQQQQQQVKIQKQNDKKINSQKELDKLNQKADKIQIQQEKQTKKQELQKKKLPKKAEDDINLIPYINEDNNVEIQIKYNRILKNLEENVVKGQKNQGTLDIHNINLEVEKVKNLYLSYDSGKLTSTLINLDIEEMCFCLASAVHKHLENFQLNKKIVQNNSQLKINNNSSYNMSKIQMLNSKLMVKSQLADIKEVNETSPSKNNTLSTQDYKNESTLSQCYNLVDEPTIIHENEEFKQPEIQVSKYLQDNGKSFYRNQFLKNQSQLQEILRESLMMQMDTKQNQQSKYIQNKKSQISSKNQAEVELSTNFYEEMKETYSDNEEDEEQLQKQYEQQEQQYNQQQEQLQKQYEQQQQKEQEEIQQKNQPTPKHIKQKQQQFDKFNKRQQPNSVSRNQSLANRLSERDAYDCKLDFSEDEEDSVSISQQNMQNLNSQQMTESEEYEMLRQEVELNPDLEVEDVSYQQCYDNENDEDSSKDSQNQFDFEIHSNASANVNQYNNLNFNKKNKKNNNEQIYDNASIYQSQEFNEKISQTLKAEQSTVSLQESNANFSMVSHYTMVVHDNDKQTRYHQNKDLFDKTYNEYNDDPLFQQLPPISLIQNFSKNKDFYLNLNNLQLGKIGEGFQLLL